MPLSPGTTLGSYSVTAKIGEGGMGEVYRARDTKLDRDVALKVLPEAFTQDPDRLARFEREAKVLASLNHPNIAAIYGLEEAEGVRALVLELVEGPTLADRIKRGPIPLDEALPIAKQIAEALEAAHEAGVIHRDLKPANIKVRDDGMVKVLDFGLAKALDPTPEGDPSLSPTLTAAATQMGVIMGTAAYMSPEQAAGKVVDKRGDIWSFGVVLFEMLTGERLFTGETVSHVLAKVLDRDLDFTALPAATPQPVKVLLRRCLERKQKRRLGDIGEALFHLEEAATAPAEHQAPAASQPVAQPSGRRQAVPWVAGILVSGLITGIAVWAVTRTGPPETPTRVVRLHMTIPAPPTSFGQLTVAISPGGDHVAYAGSNQLYLRRMDQLDATPVTGSEGASTPFFSPDGQWIGFYADGQLMKAAVTGGAPVALCETTAGIVGAHWAQDDTIFFSGFREGIWRVSGNGGAPELVVPLREGQTAFSRPRLLPDGEWLLASVLPPPAQVVVLSLATGEQHVVIEEAGSDVAYLPTGHLAHVLNGTLLAVPFDAERLTVTGGPVPLLEGVAQGFNTVAQFVAADDGTLAYLAGSVGTAQRTLVWVDRAGQEEPIDMPPRAYGNPSLSPDGRRLAVDTPSGDDELYVYDFNTGVEEQFTFDPAFDSFPIWSPDGSQIVFTTTRNAETALYSKPADGTGSARKLGAFPFPVAPMGWTDQGETVLFGGQDFLTLRVDADGAHETLLETPFNEALFRISPNGRWIAYMSNAARSRQIWVRPFPDVSGGQRLISDGLGEDPLWGPDSRELFYVTPDAAMVVTVEAGDTFQRGTPERMFSVESYLDVVGTNWAVSPDGQRFLMVKRDPTNQVGSSGEVTIVQHWFEEVKERVPTNP